MNASEPLVVHPPGHLREPVVEGSENGEQDAADDHVVEVRDHEVRVAELPVERRRAEHDAGQSGDVKSSFPPHIVASQLKILMPVGTAMAIVDRTKNMFAFDAMPTVNM